MRRVSPFGSSGSQRIAVCSERFVRCRSRQLTETLSSPSANQRTCRSFASKLVSLTWVNGLDHVSRSRACLAQNASVFVTDSRYIEAYEEALISARAANPGGGG